MTRTSKYLILATIVFVTLINSLFVVDQRKRALVLQFGEVIKSIDKAGLKFKIPFVQNVILFDNRILDLGIKESEVTSLDKKRLIIDAFAKYKIVDPKKFYVTVNNEYNARERLMIILDSSLRRIVGEVQIISSRRIMQSFVRLRCRSIQPALLRRLVAASTDRQQAIVRRIDTDVPRSDSTYISRVDNGLNLGVDDA